MGNNVQVGTSREDTGNKKIWNILAEPSTSLWAKLYAGLSYFLICLSIFILVAKATPLFHEATFPNDANVTYRNEYHEIKARYPNTHDSFDIVSLLCCLFFIIEYILRVVFAPNRLRFVFSFLGVIDFLAILPEFIGFVMSLILTEVVSIFRLLRLLRVFCILRILRVFKHFKTMTRTEIIVRTLMSSVGELVLLFSLTAIGVLVWGTLVYYVENEDDFYGYKYESIPEACWWAVITMTTVGYGDIYPITSGGKIVSSLCAISGLLLIGLCVSALVNSMIVCSNLKKTTGNYHSTDTGNRNDTRCASSSQIPPNNRGIVE